MRTMLALHHTQSRSALFKGLDAGPPWESYAGVLTSASHEVARDVSGVVRSLVNKARPPANGRLAGPRALTSGAGLP